MRSILVVIGGLLMAMGLSMGGSAHAIGCIGAKVGSATYDNWIEKKSHVDLDMSYRDIKSGNWQICGPDGG